VGFLLQRTLHLEAATIALAGAATLMLIGRVNVHRALGEVEWATILFFVGLFVLVGVVEKAGLLRLAAESVIGLTGGNVVVTTLVILWFAAVVSALVDNIPAAASLVPVVFAVARLLHPGVPDEVLVHLPTVLPYWWALALGACLGGNATLVAASANIVVANASARRGDRISFWDFTRVGLPITLASLVIASGYLYLRYLI
jgi:Na+/H+ antiporter NhaD/arsenite permease-like protein